MSDLAARSQLVCWITEAMADHQVFSPMGTTDGGVDPPLGCGYLSTAGANAVTGRRDQWVQRLPYPTLGG